MKAKRIVRNEKKNNHTLLHLSSATLCTFIAAVILLFIFAPFIYSEIINVKTAVDEIEKTVPQMDTENPSMDDLVKVNEAVEKMSPLKDSISSFMLTTSLFLFCLAVIWSVGASISVAIKLDQQIWSKEMVIRSAKWLGIILLCFAGVLLLFMVFSYVLASFAFINTNLSFTILSWLSFILVFLTIGVVYARFVGAPFGRTVGFRALSLAGIVIVLLIIKFLIETTYDWAALQKLGILLVIIVLLGLCAVIIAYERAKL